MFSKDHVTTKQSTKNLTMFAVFSALVIILQVLATLVFPKIIGFSITLTLVPIVLCSIMMGPFYGALIGIVFAAIVLIFCLTGTDVGGAVLIQAHPITTCLVVITKGVAAGFFSGLIYKPFRNKTIGTIVAAGIAPIANTGLFCAALPVFYYDILVSWADGKSILVYIFTVLLGINFLIEFGINILLSPVIIAVMKAIKKT